MNSKKFFQLLRVSMVFLLASCGGGGSETTSSDSTSTDSTAMSAPTEINTIITTPENMMIADHKVADFEKWKASYEAHDSLRLANGIHSYVIGRGMEDPNMVMVAVKVDDVDKAKAFSKDPSLKAAMQKGGVTGTPSFRFITMTFQDTAIINSDLRSRTTFTVKDWAAWEQAFKEGEQERLDNGITVRAYGHDVDDDHKVVLVTAVTDTAKAFAYYKSDALKQRRAAGGVTDEPKRTLFRIAARY